MKILEQLKVTLKEFRERIKQLLCKFIQYSTV